MANPNQQKDSGGCNGSGQWEHGDHQMSLQTSSSQATLLHAQGQTSVGPAGGYHVMGGGPQRRHQFAYDRYQQRHGTNPYTQIPGASMALQPGSSTNTSWSNQHPGHSSASHTTQSTPITQNDDVGSFYSYARSDGHPSGMRQRFSEHSLRRDSASHFAHHATASSSACHIDEPSAQSAAANLMNVGDHFPQFSLGIGHDQRDAQQFQSQTPGCGILNGAIEISNGTSPDVGQFSDQYPLFHASDRPWAPLQPHASDSEFDAEMIYQGTPSQFPQTSVDEQLRGQEEPMTMQDLNALDTQLENPQILPDDDYPCEESSRDAQMRCELNHTVHDEQMDGEHETDDSLTDEVQDSANEDGQESDHSGFGNNDEDDGRSASACTEETEGQQKGKRKKSARNSKGKKRKLTILAGNKLKKVIEPKRPNQPCCSCIHIKTRKVKKDGSSAGGPSSGTQEPEVPLRWECVKYEKSGQSFFCTVCKITLNSVSRRNHHHIGQHWGKSQMFCIICSGCAQYCPLEERPSSDKEKIWSEPSRPWKCLHCPEDDHRSFFHTWEIKDHLLAEHYYAVSSTNMFMVRRVNDAASGHFSAFRDRGHAKLKAWIKAKLGRYFTVHDASYDILRFCDIDGAKIAGLTQLGRCRIQQENLRTLMITSQWDGYTQTVRHYLRLSHIAVHWERAVGEDVRHVGQLDQLRWPRNGSGPSRLLYGLEMLTYHREDCQREAASPPCEFCLHDATIAPEELADLAVRLAHLDQRPEPGSPPSDVRSAFQHATESAA